jgi:hypothetical protein
MITRLTILLATAVATAAGAGALVAPLTPANGQWIWCSGPASPRNSYAYFRKSFTLSTAPRTAAIGITADSRYILYVNGTLVGRGPARCHRGKQSFDTYDIAAYLRTGANVIAALVHHYGESTFAYQQGRAGFLCEAVISSRTTTTIRSDGTWKALAASAWDASGSRMNLQLGYPEVYDARLAPDGWNTAGFVDTSWPSAVVIGPATSAPWLTLQASNLPPPATFTASPVSVLRLLDVAPLPPAARLDLGRDVERSGWAVAYVETWLYAPTARTVTLQLSVDDVYRAWLNDAVVMQNKTPSRAAPGANASAVTLKAGWNHLLVKCVQLTDAWEMFVGLSGTGATGVVISSRRSLSAPDTYRVSTPYAYDGSKGAGEGLATVFPPEQKNAKVSWREIKAPVRTLSLPATTMRAETAQASQTGSVRLLSTAPPGPVQIVNSNGMDGAALYDFGRELAGYPRITISDALGGEVVDIGYAEALVDSKGAPISPASGKPGRLNPQYGHVQYADRFICKPGTNVFETFDKRAFRYLQVDVRGARQPVTVAPVTVTVSTYPVVNVGAFECSDDRLNRIWDIGRWTLQLNMEDAYTDCPWRERAQWWGDARVSALVNYYAFGDTTLVRRGLQQAAEAQDSEGLVPGVFPTEFYGNRLPSYALHWVISLQEYWLHTGDLATATSLLPAVEKCLAFFDGKVNPKLGLLENVPYWVFIDGAPKMDGQRIGASASLNAWYVQALKCAAAMARASGQTAKAATWEQKASAIAAAFNARFWNEAKGAYWDLLLDGTPDGRISQHANALAILAGIAPQDRWERMLARITTDSAVTRVGTPYFSGFLMEAMHAANRHDLSMSHLRDGWGRMLDWGATTWWEYWEPVDSLCHAWSSAPTRDLPAWTLGVRPMTPGWKEFVVSPVWADLSWARGAVPTPAGPIDASWSRDAGGVTQTLTVPPGTVAHVRIPTAGIASPAAKVNGSASLPSDVVLEPSPGFWSARFPPGTWTIRVGQ